MRRVHAVVFDLQPVALPQGRCASDHPVAGQIIGIKDRKLGLFVGRAHIGEDEAPVFAHGIGAVEEPVLQCAVGRLSGGFEDAALDIVEPAVIAAA